MPSLGVVRQLLTPAHTVDDCRAVVFTSEKDVGHALVDSAGAPYAYVFSRPPKSLGLPADAKVLVVKDVSLGSEALDLSDAHWCRHPLLSDTPPQLAPLAEAALASWRHAFSFSLEDPETGVIGLRPPQAGALHALHAHWSVSRETATVVMPTGTGKTETMLSTLTSTDCPRVLVVVPTDALRTQIAEKFETLGLLKVAGNAVLAATAKRPVVGTLLSLPKTVAAVDEFFTCCNVIVTTALIAGRSRPEVQARMAELCSHLFIDEAHHSEAPTWKSFRECFGQKLVVQFTATPFREDGQRIDGKFVYVYPLRQAQQDGYFRPIRFREVHEFSAAQGDRRIAEAALSELDADSTGKHVVMARVNSVARANDIHSLYQALGRYEAVVIHSDLTEKERAAAKAKLFRGAARIVVCVDMLGEGFDLPELKIAAFHDIRKSLAVTLQLAGRFTRARPDLGDPVFIANTALIDVTEELRTLYTQDPDWNSLLTGLSEAAIDEEVTSQEFFEGFERFIDEVPLKDLRPAASMVVYKTHCANWTPKRFRKGFRGLSSRDKLYHSLNASKNTLVVLAATEGNVRWSEVESIRDFTWELFVAVWDRERALLYLHGSGINGEYKELAKALCGDEDVQLVVEPDIYRCFHGINRLALNNVGLEEHMGRQLRYTGRMGSDVEARIGTSARRGAKRSVIAGKGFEKGSRTSIGAAKRGRVWSSQRLRIDSFAAWAGGVGRKLADASINSDEVLAGTLKPVQVGAVPSKVAIAVEWPLVVLRNLERTTSFVGMGVPEETATTVAIEVLPRQDDGPLVVRVFSEQWESHLKLELLSVDGGFDFRFEHVGGRNIEVRRGKAVKSLADFFTACPPVFLFADGSSLEGCEYTELPSSHLPPYPIDRLIPLDWSGVNIRAESQHEARTPGTIQHKMISVLQADASFDVIFDDDGSNEAADVLAIKVVQVDGRSVIDVDLYHLKYSLSDQPGGRIDDLYVVCGQAQRSTYWLESDGKRTELFTHLLKRDAMRTDAGRPTRFERGDVATLKRIQDMSRRAEVRMRVFVVQPGLSKAAVSDKQLTLLAVTEQHLRDKYEVPFSVMCSE